MATRAVGQFPPDHCVVGKHGQHAQSERSASGIRAKVVHPVSPKLAVQRSNPVFEAVRIRQKRSDATAQQAAHLRPNCHCYGFDCDISSTGAQPGCGLQQIIQGIAKCLVARSGNQLVGGDRRCSSPAQNIKNLIELIGKDSFERKSDFGAQPGSDVVTTSSKFDRFVSGLSYRTDSGVGASRVRGIRCVSALHGP